MFGLSFDKILVIAVIAVFLLGPDRLPGYAAKLGRLTRTVRDMANGAQERMREEMGPEFQDMDWKKLDPRQYDPRRIIREALLSDDEDFFDAGPSMRSTPELGVGAAGVSAAGASIAAAMGSSSGGSLTTTPYDSEAT